MSLPTLWPLAVLVAVLPSKMIGSVPVKITFPRPITGSEVSEILEVIAITPPPRVAVLFLMITSLIVTVPLA